VTIALDPGVFELRSLRKQGARLIARRCRTVASIMSDNPARRRWLESAGVAHLVAEDHLVLPGDAGVEAGNVAAAIPRQLFPGGELPESDPVARQTIALLIDGLLPWSTRAREICCFTHPHHGSTGSSSEPKLDERLEFIRRLIRLRGYEPISVNSPTALVLAGLAASGFTGVGLTLGASGCEVAVVHRGNEIVSDRLERGGLWIDEHVARVQQLVRQDCEGFDVLDLEAARRKKEGVALDAPSGDAGELVSELYRSLLGDLVGLLGDALISHPQISLLPQPLPIICCGGPVRIPGFLAELRRALERRQIPVRLAEVSLAGETDYTVARGCLIRAEIEQAAPSNARSGGIRTPHSALAPR